MSARDRNTESYNTRENERSVEHGHVECITEEQGEGERECTQPHALSGAAAR